MALRVCRVRATADTGAGKIRGCRVLLGVAGVRVRRATGCVGGARLPSAVVTDPRPVGAAAAPKSLFAARLRERPPDARLTEIDQAGDQQRREGDRQDAADDVERDLAETSPPRAPALPSRDPAVVLRVRRRRGGVHRPDSSAGRDVYPRSAAAAISTSRWSRVSSCAVIVTAADRSFAT